MTSALTSGPYDVIAVGGGPAGLSAAQAAAEAGAKVLLLERAREIGNPVRTSGGSFITPLRALGIPDEFWHPINELVFMAPTRSSSFSYDRAEGCVLDVGNLYRWLAQRATLAGVHVRCNVGVTGLVRRGPRVVGVTTRSGVRIHAKYVIDATGAWARLGGEVGVPPSRRRAIGLEAVVNIPNDLRRTAMFTVDQRGTYGWLFPERSGRARVGVGIIRPDSTVSPAAELARVAERITARYSLPPFSLRGAEHHAGIYPIRPPDTGRLLPCPGLVLVGDAGPGGSNLLGEGIRYAIQSGRLAGAVIGLVSTGRQPENSLRQYPKQWKRRHGRPLQLAHAANPYVSHLTSANWDSAVELLSRWSPRTMAEVLSTQPSLSLLMRACVESPKLLPAVLRMIRNGRCPPND